MDSAGAQAILDAIRNRRPWIKHLFADGAYDRTKLLDKAAFLYFGIDVMRRTDWSLLISKSASSSPDKPAS